MRQKQLDIIAEYMKLRAIRGVIVKRLEEKHNDLNTTEVLQHMKATNKKRIKEVVQQYYRSFNE
jgi:hypothetical protein